MSQERSRPEFGNAERRNAEDLIALAMAEDLGTEGDLTTRATLLAGAAGVGKIVARKPGVIAGLPILAMIAARIDPPIRVELLVKDGESVDRGSAVARLSGPLRSLLAIERTALNFIQKLSGIASLTDLYVQAVAGTDALILDTRKTTPGWRSLEKYAVRCGGGRNHRLGLFDAVLIKDNHLAALAGESDPIASAVNSARAKVPLGTVVEVEIDTLDQLDSALAVEPDIVLVDNLGAAALAEAVRRRDEKAPSILLEASGGVDLSTVADLARSGVDRISVGALTHSAPALDLGLDFEPMEGQ